MKVKRSYLKIATAFFLLLLFSCSEDRIGENEFGTLNGTVVSIGLNEPLANVRISTQPISSTVFTDEFGHFSIPEIAVGDYSVQAKKDGFLAGFEPVQILANRSVNVIFELEVSTANNKPPLAPVLISPFENELLESIEVVFEWSAEDPENDPMTYSLELRNDQNDDVLTFNDIEETTFIYSNLILGAKYFWQVSADDDINDPVISAVSTFDVINAPVENRFLFVRNMNDNNVIFSADEEGNEFQMTSQNVNSYRPRRNVSANKIAYLQSNGAQVDIYTMERDGTNKTKVTSTIKPNGFNLNEINFCWPPTSDKIFFPSFDKLYRINTNGQGIQMIYQTTDGSFISEVDVNIPANTIALKTNDQNGYHISIFTINFGGDIQEIILDDVPGAASGLNLSVTNQEVVYAYDVTGFENSNYRRLDSRIFIYSFIDGIAVDMSDDKDEGTNDLEPIFSPNEAEIIFTNTSNDGISQRNVFSLLYDEDSVERTMLFSNGFMPDWE